MWSTFSLHCNSRNHWCYSPAIGRNWKFLCWKQQGESSIIWKYFTHLHLLLNLFQDHHDENNETKTEESAEKPCNGCNGPTKEPKEIVKSGHELELEHRFNHLKEHLNKAVEVENDEHSDRKSIYLEGELSNDSKILVSATETETSMEKLSHITGDDSTLEEDESVSNLYSLHSSELYLFSQF